MDKDAGFISGVKRIWGRNPTVGTSTEHLYEFSQSIDFRTVFDRGERLDVSSSSTDDLWDEDSPGDGAWTVKIYGVDTEWRQVAEEVVLNGQSKVTTETVFMRVFGAAVTSAGADNTNAGDIYAVIEDSSAFTGGVPDTLTSGIIKILAGEGSMSTGIFSVPKRQIVKLDKLIYTNAGKSATLSILAQGNTSDLTPILEFVVPMEAGSGEVLDLSKTGLEWREGTDIIMQVKAASASAVTFAMMVLREV